MAVRALEAGLKNARDELDDRLRALADELGVRGGFATSLGEIRDSTTPGKFVYKDTGQLAEWVRDQLPHEYVPAWTETVTVEHPATVRPTVYDTLNQRLYADEDGQVVDQVTGEVLPFAARQRPSRHWSAYLTPQAKAGAREAVLSRLETLVALVTGLELEGVTNGREEAEADRS